MVGFSGVDEIKEPSTRQLVVNKVVRGISNFAHPNISSFEQGKPSLLLKYNTQFVECTMKSAETLLSNAYLLQSCNKQISTFICIYPNSGDNVLVQTIAVTKDAYELLNINTLKNRIPMRIMVRMYVFHDNNNYSIIVLIHV